MRASADHILTSHVGSLPRPDDLIEANRAREAGEATDEQVFPQKLRAAVAEVVQRQKALGIDVPGDGEYGKSMPVTVTVYENRGSPSFDDGSRANDLSALPPYDRDSRHVRAGPFVQAYRRDTGAIRARFRTKLGRPLGPRNCGLPAVNKLSR
jgi:hypothetical protein